jgi:hypothetical protein
MVRKKCNTYYFSVEGETEKWYLDWLKNIINQNENIIYKVSIKREVEKDPLTYAKTLSVIRKTVVYHLSDYESDEQVHAEQFNMVMDRMKIARTEKQISYKFGYSNLTFDLWIILHMIDCNRSIFNRDAYITYINRAYNEKFENMNEYKREDNFKRCLGKLQLSNVINAIKRAKIIMQTNNDNGYKLNQYKGYKYYKENPSLNIWEPIEIILKDCGLLN